MNLYRKLEQRLEAQAEDASPVAGSLGIRPMAMIWLAANLVVTTLLTGTLFVPGVDFSTAILTIVAGTLCGAVVLTLVGAIGTRTGLPTMALTRGSFGIRGSLLPAAANIVILMGWAWVQAMLAGVTVDALVSSLTGYSNPLLFSVVCQTIVVLLAIVGHEGIAKVEPWLAGLMLVIIAWILWTAFQAFSPAEYAALPVDPASTLTAGGTFDIVLATAITWTVLSADFNRHARTTRDGVIGSGVGYTLSTVISMSLGVVAFCYLLLRGDDPVAFDPGAIVGAFGAPLAIVIFLSVMATNSMVVYGMVTSVVNALPHRKIRFLPTALVIGAISIAGSTWFGLLDLFTSFLILIGSLFVPVFAVMIVDYYIVKRGAYSLDVLRHRAGRYWYRGGVNWIAVITWVVGAGASMLWTYVWPLPIGATVPTFALSFAIYLAAMLPERHRAVPVAHVHLATIDPSLTQAIDMTTPPGAGLAEGDPAGVDGR